MFGFRGMATMVEPAGPCGRQKGLRNRMGAPYVALHRLPMTLGARPAMGLFSFPRGVPNYVLDALKVLMR